MKKFQFIILAILVVGSVSAQRAEAGYGAIAYSVATGATGWSRSFNTQVGAEYEAIRQCNASDCQAVVWFHNACGALAVSHYNPALFGSAWNREVAFAQNQAHRLCRVNGGLDCATVQMACSP